MLSRYGEGGEFWESLVIVELIQYGLMSSPWWCTSSRQTWICASFITAHSDSTIHIPGHMYGDRYIQSCNYLA